jgi:hypothetical protein
MSGVLDPRVASAKNADVWRHRSATSSHMVSLADQAGLRARRQAYVDSVLGQYATAVQLAPRPLAEIGAAHAQHGHLPAYEYFSESGEVWLYQLLAPDILEHTALTEAFGVSRATTPNASSDLVDVALRDVPVESGAVVLYAPELTHAQGSSWRFYLTLTYSAYQGFFRADVHTRRFCVDLDL